jgi:hypothetical protein
MRSNRRRNWFIKRFALGLAIAAIAAPVAQARIDEGSSVQASGYQSFATDFPYQSPSSGVAPQGIAYRQFVTDFPSSQVNASDYGMPRAMPVDYALNRGQGTPERQPERQDRVRPHAASVDRRAAGRVRRLRLEGCWNRRGSRSRTRPPRRRSGACKPPRRSRADRLIKKQIELRRP